MSSTNLATTLTPLGRQEEAFAAAQEATDTLREKPTFDNAAQKLAKSIR
jgi:hypothetical protein